MTDFKEDANIILALGQLVLDFIIVIFKVVYFILLNAVHLVVPQRQKSVKDEIVLITGGGHGIGKELAFLYASKGATVVIWDINEKLGNQTVEEIARKGYPQAHFFCCDVSNRDTVLSVGKKVEEKVGNVTILVNNAGILATRPFLDHTPLEIERTININILAHFWTLEAFLPSMKKHNHGHVVAIASTAGLFGVSNMVSYSCSKFAVKGLMDSVYEECRKIKNNRIKFTTIYPFFVDTGFCKTWTSKFKILAPVIPTKDAARKIVKAQRLDFKEISIPRHLILSSLIYRLLPEKAQNYVTDFASITVDSDI